MGFVINNNLAANNSYRNLNSTQNDLSKSLEKLSTGLRINRAGDDAAGLSISEGLKAQVTGSAQAARNAQDGISVIQTTEGALTEVHSILQRMRDLAVQGSNDTNNTAARDAIKAEGNSLGQELDRITKATNFNGIDLLKGATGAGVTATSTPGSLEIQVGTGGTTGVDTIKVKVGDVATATGALSDAAGTGATDFVVDTAANAQTTIGKIDTAIKAISAQRADLGAAQNRLEHTVKSLNVAGENLQAAQSRIADVDMAQEMVKFTKANILSQAGTAMLAQANQSSQGVLSLLR
ncbi:flagellin [Arthrobacter sp. AL08]|uniref:flagellin N-terminal helical domain-containing protein n=1 Tax=Micrococcaceae TaxID=1268 RepID=UPI001CFFDDD4|nr:MULTISPECIES: flagellin [Micrococcaceae]MCB5283765.1 Flagellin [Arthrobacter sp. ES1]MDI3242931.1 flagellin [Arthrobacter sp. AL05]MDI3278999.1 flagellin [Arthrobacter sp. AL08]MDJ0353362.1 flagellin [Pseudarthrobacter sp. PH31-O2]WGZ79935.1 flagellin [Arthrobacter sp. EM1]